MIMAANGLSEIGVGAEELRKPSTASLSELLAIGLRFLAQSSALDAVHSASAHGRGSWTSEYRIGGGASRTVVARFRK